MSRLWYATVTSACAVYFGRYGRAPILNRLPCFAAPMSMLRFAMAK